MLERVFNKLRIPRTYRRMIGSHEFSIPVYKGKGFSNLENAEPWMLDVLYILGNDDSRFLDVGANIGQTLLKWRSLFPNADYVGFEPNRDCVEYVELLIRLNQFENCELIPCALSLISGFQNLYLLGKDPVDSSATTIENFRENESRRAVKIETMAFKSLENTQFDLIKIDVEGSESEILSAIFSVGTNALIICEILPIYDVSNQERLQRQEKIESILSENNYSIFRIKKSKPIRVEKISSIGIHGNLEDSDYIFIPRQRESEILSKFN